MTLQASGAISLNDIQVEFGGPSSNITLQSYYAGGSYVASGTLNGSGVAIPASGAIKLEDFYGASAVTFPANGAQWGASRTDALTQSTSCFLILQGNGTVTSGGSGGSATNHFTGPTTWINPTSAAGNYQMIIDSLTNVVDNSPTVNIAMGTWTSVGCTFSASAQGGRSSDGIFHCRMRNATTLAIVATFTVELSLDNT